MDRLNRALGELDTLLPAEQLQQYEHQFVRAQGSQQSNVIVQRGAYAAGGATSGSSGTSGVRFGRQ